MESGGYFTALTTVQELKSHTKNHIHYNFSKLQNLLFQFLFFFFFLSTDNSFCLQDHHCRKLIPSLPWQVRKEFTVSEKEYNFSTCAPSKLLKGTFLQPATCKKESRFKADTSVLDILFICLNVWGFFMNFYYLLTLVIFCYGRTYKKVNFRISVHQILQT